MNGFREDTQPWYRQFWPWFLISLPATAVVAGFITLGIAIDSDDGLVTDDYYKKGLAVHKDAARFSMARQLGVQASISVEESTGNVDVQLNDAPIGDLRSLTLTFFHPTRSDQDIRVDLARTADGRYEGRATKFGPANWKLSIDPPEATWRITGRMPVPQQWTAQLD